MNEEAPDWRLVPVASDEVTAAWLYEKSTGHRLVPENPELAVLSFRSLAQDAKAYHVVENLEEVVATVLVSGKVAGESAVIDLIPESRRFRYGYKEPFRSAMAPLWIQLFEVDKLRRVTSFVPASRARTRRALHVCGFKHEGTLREGVQFRNQDPEDVYVLGLLALEYVVPED